MAENYLLINGSNRKKGTSLSFARTFKAILEEKDAKAEIINVMDFYSGTKSFEELKSMISKCDAIGIFAPMYLDFLPCSDLWLMEKLGDEFRDGLKGKSLFAVCQFGFPDVSLGKPILETCRIFSNSMSMKWLGGLSYGGGAMIDGRNLEDIGKSGQKLINGFRMACERIAAGDAIPEKAQEAITISLPRILYRPMAAFLNFRSRKTAKEKGTLKDFYAKPYLEG